jgi:hypothetical protein
MMVRKILDTVVVAAQGALDSLRLIYLPQSYRLAHLLQFL